MAGNRGKRYNDEQTIVILKEARGHPRMSVVVRANQQKQVS